MNILRIYLIVISIFVKIVLKDLKLITIIASFVRRIIVKNVKEIIILAMNALNQRYRNKEIFYKSPYSFFREYIKSATTNYM